MQMLKDILTSVSEASDPTPTADAAGAGPPTTDAEAVPEGEADPTPTADAAGAGPPTTDAEAVPEGEADPTPTADAAGAGPPTTDAEAVPDPTPTADAASSGPPATDAEAVPEGEAAPDGVELGDTDAGGAIPGEGEATHDSAGAIPEEEEATHDGAGAIPEEGEATHDGAAIPEEGEPTHDGAGAIPEEGEATHDGAAIPEEGEPTHDGAGAIPEEGEVAHDGMELEQIRPSQHGQSQQQHMAKQRQPFTPLTEIQPETPPSNPQKLLNQFRNNMAQELADVQQQAFNEEMERHRKENEGAAAILAAEVRDKASSHSAAPVDPSTLETQILQSPSSFCRMPTTTEEDCLSQYVYFKASRHARASWQDETGNATETGPVRTCNKDCWHEPLVL